MKNEAYYYVPLCNKDFTFENLFSSESISPISFYSKRSFGITHFFKIDEFYLNEAIVLYNAIPKFKVDRPDAIKFILAIKQSEIEKDDIIFISEGILGLQKTIYLTKENFKILFFSEKDMKFVQAKSELSLPTKSTKKYQKNFEIIDEALCVEVDAGALRKMKLEDSNPKEILFDKKFNAIKGFIYGLVTEIAFEKSPDEIKLKRSIQQLINVHAEFKNRLSIQNKQSDSRYNRPGVPIKPYFDKVLETLNSLEDLFFSFFPKSELTSEDLAHQLFENNKSLFASIEDALMYVHHKFIDRVILNSNDYDLIKKKVISSLKKPDAGSLLEVLKNNFKENFSPSGQFIRSRSNSFYNDEEFKETVFKLNFLVEEYFSVKTNNVKLNFDQIIVEPSTEKIYFKENLGLTIDKSDEKEYIVLSNIILDKYKKEKGEARKNDLLEIVKIGATARNKTVDSSETLLYKYLNGQIDVYPLDKVNSVVMKNFVAFIFNPDSLEALEKYLQVHEIQNKWMAYSFWCGFNGFANVSSTFLKPLFDKDLEIQDSLDNYFTRVRSILQGGVQDDIKKDNFFQDRNSLESDFFEKYIRGRFQLTLDEMISVLGIKKDGDKLKALKNKFNIDEKTGKNILVSYKEFTKSPNLF